jgi:hypothetical protein
MIELPFNDQKNEKSIKNEDESEEKSTNALNEVNL